MSFFTSFGKKISAVFILGMLLFIQAEKLLHKHIGNTVCHHEQVQCIKSLNSICSICEFQIAREAALPDISIPKISDEFVSKEYITLTLAYHTNYFRSLPGRGPPAIA